MKTTVHGRVKIGSEYFDVAAHKQLIGQVWQCWIVAANASGTKYSDIVWDKTSAGLTKKRDRVIKEIKRKFS